MHECNIKGCKEGVYIIDGNFNMLYGCIFNAEFSTQGDIEKREIENKHARYWCYKYKLYIKTPLTMQTLMPKF